MKLARIVGLSSATATFLSLATNVIAQTTPTITPTTGGGTASALPNAGTTEITYAIFAGGLLLFVVGTMKLILSYRD